MRHRKNGFTLIELIVVIAIMGVILILALPQIGRIRENNRDAKYEAYLESIERAAKLYVDSRSTDLFGYNDFGCVVVSYSTLLNANLIKDFSDSDITCSDDDETYVQVRKVNDNYQYNTSLICKNKDDSSIVYEHSIDTEFSCDLSKDTSGPSIVVSPSQSEWMESKDLSVKITVTDPSGLNNNIGITYYWTDTSGNVVSNKYNYNYKNKKNVQTVTHSIPASRIPDDSGQYKLVVEPWDSDSTCGLQDMLGNYTLLSTTTGNYKLDNDPPTCVSSGGSDTFVYEPVTIIGTCSDEHSGCVKKTVIKTFTVDYMDEYVSPGTVYDNVGHSTVCPVQRVRMDTIPKKPTISNPTNGNWVNYDFSLQVKTESPSDLIGYWQYSYDQEDWITYSDSATNNFTTTPFSKERNQYVYIRVCSKYGSCSEAASTRIRIDKTPPNSPYYDSLSLTDASLSYGNVYIKSWNCSNRGGNSTASRCDVYVNSLITFWFVLDTIHTDNTGGSGVNENAIEFWWEHQGYSYWNCPYWFKKGQGCDNTWNVCGSSCYSSSYYTYLIYKERLYDNAGNLGPELTVYFHFG